MGGPACVAPRQSVEPYELCRRGDYDATKTLFGRMMQQAEDAKLASADHFSVDGTLIRAWASIKRFVPKHGPPPEKTGSKSNPEVDSKRQKRLTREPFSSGQWSENSPGR